jgi:hypothetical protein
LILALSIFTPTVAKASNPCPDASAFSGISGLSLWLRADCVNGVATDPADNSAVTTWWDFSGNGNNASAVGTPTFQSDAANLINSQPVINFNGSSRFNSIDIRATTRPNITIFAVYKELGSGDREGVWGIDDGGWDRFFLARWVGTSGLISAGNSANVANSGVIGTPTLITTIYKHNVSNGTTVYRNGDLAATLTDATSLTAAYSTLYIGSGGNGLNFNGDIAEIIVFDQALTNSNLLTVNGYLNTKYNLNIASGNLPVAITAPTFNSFALTGSATTATYRTSITVTASVSQTSKITFTVNGKFLPSCRNRLTSVSGSNHLATCTWRPSNRGSVSVSARAVATAGGLTSSPTVPLRVQVTDRKSTR